MAMTQLEKQRDKEIREQQRKHEEQEWKEQLEKMNPTGKRTHPLVSPCTVISSGSSACSVMENTTTAVHVTRV